MFSALKQSQKIEILKIQLSSIKKHIEETETKKKYLISMHKASQIEIERINLFNEIQQINQDLSELVSIKVKIITIIYFDLHL
ncbi:hypothetical protein [Aquirufa sp. ROCK-SH2]